MTTSTITELRSTLHPAANDSERLSAMLDLVRELLTIDPRQGRVLAGDALALAEELKDDNAVANAMLLIGMVHIQFGEYHQALEQLEQALVQFEKLGNRQDVALVMGSLGDTCRELGEYTKALEHCHSALELHQELGDRYGSARVMGTIGLVYRELGEYARALEHQQSSLAQFEELGRRGEAAIAMGSIGNTYRQFGEYSKALELLDSARRVHEALGERAEVARVTWDIGRVYHDMGEYARAMEQYQAALALFEELGNRGDVARMMVKIGWLYAQKGWPEYDPASAENYLLQAVQSMTELGIRQWLHESHHLLAELYREQGRWQESYEHLALSHELREELNTIEAHKKLEQIEHLKQIAAMEKRRALEQADAQAQREALHLQTQLLEVQLDRQRTELASQAMHLARQTEMLGDFRNDLRAIMREGGDPLITVKQIKEKLKELPCEAIDWTKFDAEFRQTYPEFQSKLLQKYPELTGMEMKICALLKLKLTSADISKLLCLSERSVEGHRLRLRRKMGLVQGEDVHAVLAAI